MCCTGLAKQSCAVSKGGRGVSGTTHINTKSSGGPRHQRMFSKKKKSRCSREGRKRPPHQRQKAGSNEKGGEVRKMTEIKFFGMAGHRETNHKKMKIAAKGGET